MGERLVAALVLDRSDWLREAGYTLAQAIERVGPEWLAQVPTAAQQLRRELATIADALLDASELEAQEALLSNGSEQHLSTKLLTYGSAPGYRTPSLIFELQPVGSTRVFRAHVNLRAEDCEAIVRHIVDVHAFAWDHRPDRGPLDRRPGEARPCWIDRRRDA
jgi:hypothetical protein